MAEKKKKAAGNATSTAAKKNKLFFQLKITNLLNTLTTANKNM